jgi:hypothetical protein
MCFGPGTPSITTRLLAVSVRAKSRTDAAVA